MEAGVADSKGPVNFKRYTGHWQGGTSLFERTGLGLKALVKNSWTGFMGIGKGLGPRKMPGLEALLKIVV